MPQPPSRHSRIQHPHRSTPRSFTPIKLRARRDGWSAGVQCDFLAQLYLTGSVARAAHAVGRSRASAYALRKRRGAESFADEWDRVLAGPAQPGAVPARRRKTSDCRKLTLKDLIWRFEIGLWRPVIYRGKMRGIAHKPDNTALLRMLSRMDAKADRLARDAP